MVIRGDASGPLFIWVNGRYLTQEKFVAGVRRALEVELQEPKLPNRSGENNGTMWHPRCLDQDDGRAQRT